MGLHGLLQGYLRDERGLRAFENRVRKEIFEPMSAQAIRGLRKQLNEFH
jgi:hypothetical protein